MENQECKCELDGFQGAIWKGDCPIHSDKPLNKQKMRERFYEFWNEEAKYTSTNWLTPDTHAIIAEFLEKEINLALQEQQEELNYIKKEFNELSERYNKQQEEIIKKMENEAKKYYSQERNLIGNAIEDIISLLLNTNTE